MLTVHITLSTDPRMDLARYPLFADVRFNGQQITTKRGNREEIDAFITEAREQAAVRGMSITVTHDLAPERT